MFESYQKLERFNQDYLSHHDLSIEQKLAILDGMLKHARLLRKDIFADPYSGINEKIAFIKLLHGISGTSR